MNAHRTALLAGACSASLAAPALAQLSVGPNINLSQRSGEQAEGAIAIDPANPTHIFMASNHLSGAGMGRAYSLDGGATWTRNLVATGADITAANGDPSVAFDSFGNLFLCYLTASGINTVVARSTDGGVTFAAPVTVATSTDQPTVVTGPGVVWVTYDKSGGMNSSVSAVTGLGSALAFSTPVLITGSNSSISGGFGEVAVGPGNRVAAVYQNTATTEGPDNVYFNFNATGGFTAASWGARSTVSPTNVGSFDHIPAQAQRSIDAEVSLGYDRSGGAHNGRLYLVYTDESPNESGDTNIMLRFSDDNGGTWSPAARLNDDATTRSQFLPKLAVDQATGHLAVAWYDARNDAANVGSAVYATASFTGGATWLPNVRVATGTSNSTLVGTFDFGDYTGIAMHNDVIFPLWADNSNSTGDNPNGTSAMDMYTARLSLCYANCDGSPGGLLDSSDFNCFLVKFLAADPYADCDGNGILDSNDFNCLLVKFLAGCP